MASSPDGKLLASAHMNGVVKLWDTDYSFDLPSDECIKTINAHTNSGSGQATSVSFSSDRKWLATASNFETKVWDLRTYQNTMTTQSEESFSKVIFHPDGKSILCFGIENSFNLISAVNGTNLIHFKGHSGGILHLSVSRDGRFIASSSYDKTVKIWNAQTGSCMKTISVQNTSVMSTFNADGSRIVIACSDGLINIWNTVTWEVENTINYTATISNVYVNNCNDLLVIRNTTDEVKVYHFDFTNIVFKGRLINAQVFCFQNCGTTVFMASSYEDEFNEDNVLLNVSAECVIEEYCNARLQTIPEKGEFEKTIDYEKRVTAAASQSKQELIDQLLDKLLAGSSRSMNISLFHLGTYNADEEFFPISSSFGTFKLPVPISVAENVKNNWAEFSVLDYSLNISNDRFKLADFTFSNETRDTFYEVE